MIRTRPTSVARPPGDDALGRRTREPGAHQFDHLRDGEAVREHDRFGAAVARRGEQFKRGAAVGLWAATRGGEVGHGVAAAVVDLVGRITCRGRAGMPSTARSESFEAVDVRTALRGSNHQASKRGVIGEYEHGCARLDTAGNSPTNP